MAMMATLKLAATTLSLIAAGARARDAYAAEAPTPTGQSSHPPNSAPRHPREGVPCKDIGAACSASWFDPSLYCNTGTTGDDWWRSQCPYTCGVCSQETGAQTLKPTTAATAMPINPLTATPQGPEDIPLFDEPLEEGQQLSAGVLQPASRAYHLVASPSACAAECVARPNNCKSFSYTTFPDGINWAALDAGARRNYPCVLFNNVDSTNLVAVNQHVRQYMLTSARELFELGIADPTQQPEVLVTASSSVSRSPPTPRPTSEPTGMQMTQIALWPAR